jgi:hypothetical protein
MRLMQTPVETPAMLGLMTVMPEVGMTLAVAMMPVVGTMPVLEETMLAEGMMQELPATATATETATATQGEMTGVEVMTEAVETMGVISRRSS